ncbi:glycosyltransferase family 2 protein [Acinetobacter portensis]|uniref:glycosyltransferase family 2 protein n=2 Tax=Acinetobacter portensis TaxID=1839785 RepID=UPI0036099D2A
MANCLDNLLSQSYSNLEIWVVDDGSTDKTVDIIRNYAKDHKNIHYIVQANKGAAKAREAGMLRCDAEFVTFLDADDLFSPDAILLAMSEFNKDIDIILYKLAVSQNEQNSVFKLHEYFTEDIEFTGLMAFQNCLSEWKVHGLGVFRKKIFLDSYNLYKKYNHNGENYINNDEIITKFNFLNARNVRVCDGVYYYNFNTNSTTKKAHPNFYKIINNTHIIIQACHDHNIPFNESSILMYDVWLVESKFKQWKSELSNASDWKKALRLEIKKIISLENKGITFKLRLKYLKKRWCFQKYAEIK